MTKYNPSTPKIPQQQRYDAQNRAGEVASLKELISHLENKKAFVILARGVSEKICNFILNKLNLDISGYDHIMDSSAVNHAINKHKNDPIPLKLTDFRLVPNIIKNFDNLTYAGKNRRGLHVIQYTKNYKSKRLVYLEEIRRGRHKLAMNTLYWQKTSKK